MNRHSLPIQKLVKPLIDGERSYIFLKDVVPIENLPDTPFRGQSKMHAVKLPALSLKIDTVISDIARGLGSEKVNFQYNIDSFDPDLWNSPLGFHFDRGTKYTILAGLRGCVNKYTALLPVDKIAKSIENRTLINYLCEPYYRANSNAYGKAINPIPVFSRNSGGQYNIAPAIIINNLELADLYADSRDHAFALELLLHTIKDLESILLNKEIYSVPEVYKIYDAQGFCLMPGDILVLNNSSVFHGRTAGRVLDVAQNRWIRASFI